MRLIGWLMWLLRRERSSGKRTWYGPLSFLKRSAKWQHRVELPEGRRCWTIIWTSAKVRDWGFICPERGWISHPEHEDKGCG
jgi:hypothetical protein